MSNWLSVSLTIGVTAWIGLVMLRNLIKRGLVRCDCPSKSKHVVITGATSGIGRAATREFAKRGCKITIGCRNVDAGTCLRQEIIAQHPNLEVNVRHLDLTQRSSILDFADSLLEIPIDVLVNNAGVMSTTPDPVNDFNNIEVDAVTNYLGHFLLTHRLLPNLLTSGRPGRHPSRIVIVSSALAKKGCIQHLLLPWTGARTWNTTKEYANSKLACCLFARELHRRYGGEDKPMLNVYCMFTGGMVNTNLNRHVISRVPWLAQRPMKFLSWFLLKSPEEGCQSIIHCAMSNDVINAHRHGSRENSVDASGAGLVYSNCVPVEWPGSAANMQKAVQLWDNTVSVLGLSTS